MHAYSSLLFYQKGDEPEWLINEAILAQFRSREEYMKFVSDYEAHKLILEELRQELADV